MKRPEPTARTLKRRETREVVFLLLAIAAVVLLLQMLLFLTITRLGAGSVSHLILG